MQVLIRHKSTEPKKAWFKVVLLLILWSLIWSLLRDSRRIGKGFERKAVAEERLNKELAENEALKRELTEVSSLSYKEGLIRGNLNMQKMGEVVVVLPRITSGDKGEVDSSKVMGSNWERWWRLVVY